ncbi:MAG TPA: alcohol dehydrogenase catalytic domain-containing protein [Acidimicrobiales bacterium]|nr:alcohol dehydrogenase catalytic domain-containing protein [Acidimicrobiales bacterium]
MRQVIVRSAGVVDIVEAEVPNPGPGEVRVRSAVVGICGSDLHALAGEHPFIDLPYSPGHEVVGVVDALGPGATGPAVGERVLLEPNLVCGHCSYCVSGRYNLCEVLAVVGCQTAGGMADAFVAPASRFHVVPEGMSDAQAALVEPMSTAMHAVRVAGDLVGRRVAVLGGGSIGLLTLVAANKSGAAMVAVTEPIEPKRELALRLGADLAIDPTSDDAVGELRRAFAGRADVVFDCVSSQTSITQAISLAEKGGSVIVVGVAAHDVTIPLSIVQDREIRLEGSAMYTAQDVRAAMGLVGGASFPANDLVTATLPLDDAAQAFRLASGGDQVKVHVAVAR